MTMKYKYLKQTPVRVIVLPPPPPMNLQNLQETKNGR